MRDLTYPAIIAAARLGFRALGQDLRLSGTEHVPRRGGVLLAFNHVSYVDFIYGGFAAHPSGRRVRFMAKRELFDHRWSGPPMRSMHHIAVDRAEGEAAYRAAVDYLDAGEAVGIFPEATISRAMTLKPFKTGAVRIAARAGVPIVPVILWGTQRMITKDHPRDLSRGRTITIDVGEAIRPTGEHPLAETAELKERMALMLAAAIERHPDGRPAGAWWLPASQGGGAPTLEEAARLDTAERAERVRRYREMKAKQSGDTLPK
ncbi:MAG: lysophospholipid acyltransferase family protein [Nocardioides sp.]